MKVLMLSWEFPPLVTGGLGRHVAELAPALAKEGVRVHVLAPHPEPPQATQTLQHNLMIHWVNVASVNAQADIHTRTLLINELIEAAANKLWPQIGVFDLIHVHDWLLAQAAIALKLKHKCPIVGTIHATERGRWRNQALPNELARKIDSIERNLSFEAWRVIACSHFMVRELMHQFSLPPDKLDMIPNGINLANRSQHMSHQLIECRAKYVTPDQLLIFSVGRLVYEKGFHVLIGAMPQILQEYPGAKLLIAGKGPLLGYLQQTAQDLGLNSHVHFAGFVNDKERDMLFSVADCAVFPSLYEPFGIVALEAMAHSCPVVVSNVGGFAEVVTHGKTGSLVYADNSNSTAWGILHVLNNFTVMARNIANAKRMVAEKYSWQYIARQTKKVYQRVITERAQTDW